MVKQFMVSESFTQLVSVFTRSQKTVNGEISRSCLDHVTTNVPDKCSIPVVSAAGDSDHLAVMITKYSRQLRVEPKTVKKRNYKNFDIEYFLNDIYQTDFSPVKNSQNPDLAASLFSGIFGSILNKHALVKIYQTRTKYVPWLSQNTKNLMQQQDNQKLIATRTGDPVHHDEYKRLRNLVKTKLPNDKNSFYSNILKDDNQTIPGMWATAYRALGYTKNLSPMQLVVDGKAVSAPREMANAFNNVFLKKVKDLKDGIVGPIIEEPLTRLVRWIGQRQEHIPEFTLHSITILTLRKIIKNLKGKKSSGIDMIDGYSVKLASPLIEDTLLHLVNLSIEESHYPKYWKVSKIAPLYKKDDRTNGENYRPVSNIIFVSQICEKAVFDQVFCHFQSHHLFHPNNHGFRPCHSTVSALIQLQDLWLLAAERHEISASLLLNLSATFDLVEHEILLGKLGIYGFSPSSLNWFASYLKDRIQYVQVESRLSDPQPTGSQGAPQGSLLGPLLFLIFLQQLP